MLIVLSVICLLKHTEQNPPLKTQQNALCSLLELHIFCLNYKRDTNLTKKANEFYTCNMIAF